MSGGFKYLRKKIYLYPSTFPIIPIFNDNKKRKFSLTLILAMKKIDLDVHRFH